MWFLARAAQWFLLLHCSLGLMSDSPDKGDLSKLFSGYEPTKHRGFRIGARTAFLAHVTIEQGKEVFEYAKLYFGAAELEAAVKEGRVRLMHGLWRGFLHNCLKRTPSRALSDMYRKAFKKYISSLEKSAVTVCGMMGESKRDQRRKLGGELNSVKCLELGQLLYTWFIDCVQIRRSQVDSLLLMRYAQFSKERFLAQGYEPTLLPKLTG